LLQAVSESRRAFAELSCCGIYYHRPVRVNAGPAENGLQRLGRNIHGWHSILGRPQETFVQIDCSGKMAHDIVVHIGLYIEDQEIFFIYVICQPIRRNPLHYALAKRIRIRLHDLKTPRSSS
jgi:hypothetical protein